MTPIETPAEAEVKNKMNETGETQTSFCSLMRDFFDYTSAHGFGRISAVKHWTRTVFWSLLFIGAVSMLSIQVHTLFLTYQSRPLTTLVTVKKETSLQFPMVTFCNFNALKPFSNAPGSGNNDEGTTSNAPGSGNNDEGTTSEAQGSGNNDEGTTSEAQGSQNNGEGTTSEAQGSGNNDEGTTSGKIRHGPTFVS
ncbi:hypothetical protein OS493_001976 [Desmophyllum pertusum]|uniref:Uncharacterized protein n=1 Tax=Desmophyllum pertusum TaxID=174260 RepID=A0A9W9Z562_9CNID|nr:hypothetical protein OS493_001976 [Desmophyllum pertusum]